MQCCMISPNDDLVADTQGRCCTGGEIIVVVGKDMVPLDANRAAS